MNITQVQALLILEMAQKCWDEGSLSRPELALVEEVLRAFPALRELRGNDGLLEYESLFKRT